MSITQEYYYGHVQIRKRNARRITEAQAEALADEQVNLMNSNLATKQDLLALKSELLKWMIGAMIAQGGVIVALIELL